MKEYKNNTDNDNFSSNGMLIDINHLLMSNEFTIFFRCVCICVSRPIVHFTFDTISCPRPTRARTYTHTDTRI